MEKKSSGCKRSITITLGRDCPFQDCSKKLLFKIRNIRQRLYPLPKSMSIILNNANKYLFDKQESAPVASLSSQKKDLLLPLRFRRKKKTCSCHFALVAKKRPAPATSLSSQKKSAPATSLSSQKKSAPATSLSSQKKDLLLSKN
ncbi:hypothetical protein [Rummeliibacillus suwonensis]|uniref:hypothetical protein n=1 Tax=Rummeliibacillus suwonensis TaxID=1306154 RepID=UPI001AAF3C40|nr:hypothetical protein [Rummeliibacillus suwonensis]MBO2537623.1 hypothetical protein [Rummeliibacillus suwonensis]